MTERTQLLRKALELFDIYGEFVPIRLDELQIEWEHQWNKDTASTEDSATYHLEQFALRIGEYAATAAAETRVDPAYDAEVRRTALTTRFRALSKSAKASVLEV